MSKNKSAFVKVLGNTPYIRVLDFLLTEGRILEYSLTDISKHTDVSWSTLHQVWPSLEELEIVVMTRTVGRSKLYRLNEENSLVKILIKSDFLISKSLMDIKRGRTKKKDIKIDKEFKALEKMIVP